MTQENTTAQPEKEKAPKARIKSAPAKQAASDVPVAGGNTGGEFDRYIDDMLGSWRGMMNSFLDAASPPNVPTMTSPMDIENLQSQADRYFADIKRRWSDITRLHPLSMFAPLSGLSSAPAFDLKQEDGGYVISGAVPGMDADDITVEVDGHVLKISGETSATEEKDQNGFKLHSERTGSFTQHVCLPQDAVVDKVEATVEKGLVTVSVPKAAEFKSKPRKITINR